eukprot:5754032-Prymnesium_polylepis.2
MNSAISTTLSSYSDTTVVNSTISTALVSYTDTHTFYPHQFAVHNPSSIQVGDIMTYYWWLYRSSIFC